MQNNDQQNYNLLFCNLTDRDESTQRQLDQTGADSATQRVTLSGPGPVAKPTIQNTRSEEK